jgi:hypothetical protein
VIDEATNSTRIAFRRVSGSSRMGRGSLPRPNEPDGNLGGIREVQGSKSKDRAIHRANPMSMRHAVSSRVSFSERTQRTGLGGAARVLVILPERTQETLRAGLRATWAFPGTNLVIVRDDHGGKRRSISRADATSLKP